MTDKSFYKSLTKIPKDAIILIEDLDTLCEETRRQDRITLSGILNILDGASEILDGKICFITTNHIDKINNAILRPGRINKIIHFNYMNSIQIQNMVKFFIEDSKIQQQLIDYLKGNISPARLQDFLYRYHDDKNIIKHLHEVNNKDDDAYMNIFS